MDIDNSKNKLRRYFITISKYIKSIKNRKFRIFAYLMILVLLLITIRKTSFVFIPPGESGVVFNYIGNGITDKVLREGIHFIAPGLQTVYSAKTSRQSAHIERITADSLEFQDVALWLNVEYEMKESSVPDFFRTFGLTTSSEIVSEYLVPNVNEVTKNIVINYQIGTILKSQMQIKEQIKNDLSALMEEYYIEIIDVDIENIRLSPQFRDIVADIEFAEYEKKREEIQLEISMHEAERRVLEAETLKNELIMQAEAEAQYNNLLSQQTITEAMLEYRRLENQRLLIEKWDGSMPSQIGNISDGLFE